MNGQSLWSIFHLSMYALCHRTWYLGCGANLLFLAMTKRISFKLHKLGLIFATPKTKLHLILNFCFRYRPPTMSAEVQNAHTEGKPLVQKDEVCLSWGLGQEGFLHTVIRPSFAQKLVFKFFLLVCLGRSGSKDWGKPPLCWILQLSFFFPKGNALDQYLGGERNVFTLTSCAGTVYWIQCLEECTVKS